MLAAGGAAGAVNAVVGAGTLVTFSTLVTLGVPPLTANVSNTVGLVSGSVAGSVGYRREVRDQRHRLVHLAPASIAGGLTGAVLLLVLPSAAFEAVVPVLIALGIVLVLVQPWLAARLATPHSVTGHAGGWLIAGVYLTGIYGGYFGAAQGVILIALLGLLMDRNMQRANAVKNVLAALVNGVAAVVFVLVAPVDWLVAVLIGVGSVGGGFLGAHYGRRLPQPVLRGFIVVVGLVALVVIVGR